MNTVLDGIFMTMSTFTGLYPKLDLWTANKLQLQLHRLKHHLVTTNILANEQYGFHDNVSIESAIFKLTESIFSAWNYKKYITSLFCDLTKAFDCVSHEISTLKFKFCGVKCSVLNWFKSYLHNRRQRIILQFVKSLNLLSDWEIIRHYDPQGPVFGPLLFNVYFNDFPCIINKVCHTILFTDDTNIFFPVILMN